jgi:hypothetical protein
VPRFLVSSKPNSLALKPITRHFHHHNHISVPLGAIQDVQHQVANRSQTAYSRCVTQGVSYCGTSLRKEHDVTYSLLTTIANTIQYPSSTSSCEYLQLIILADTREKLSALYSVPPSFRKSIPSWKVPNLRPSVRPSVRPSGNINM